MKSLDLKQIGLQELTTVETCSVDGGNCSIDCLWTMLFSRCGCWRIDCICCK